MGTAKQAQGDGGRGNHPLCPAGGFLQVVEHFTELGLRINSARVSSDGGWFVDGELAASALGSRALVGLGQKGTAVANVPQLQLCFLAMGVLTGAATFMPACSVQACGVQRREDPQPQEAAQHQAGWLWRGQVGWRVCEGGPPSWGRVEEGVEKGALSCAGALLQMLNVWMRQEEDVALNGGTCPVPAGSMPVQLAVGWCRRGQSCTSGVVPGLSSSPGLQQAAAVLCWRCCRRVR